jgi:hypothetical protein
MATADAATLFVETTLGTRLVVSFLTYATTVADLKRAFSPRFLLPPPPLEKFHFFSFYSFFILPVFSLGIFGHPSDRGAFRVFP